MAKLKNHCLFPMRKETFYKKYRIYICVCVCVYKKYTLKWEKHRKYKIGIIIAPLLKFWDIFVPGISLCICSNFVRLKLMIRAFQII